MLNNNEKVFGIGLSKTGTKSLSKALKILGYKTVHFPLIRTNVEEAEYNLDILENYDAIADIPTAGLFPHLDIRYPKSKFILTIRNKEDWLNSCERYFGIKDLLRKEEGTIHLAVLVQKYLREHRMSIFFK
ncbi:hypothetical protein FZC66_20125 [Priestia megaterium]|nr:hypothetical protein FZC66_20125 [Priestia megaterium]